MREGSWRCGRSWRSPKPKHPESAESLGRNPGGGVNLLGHRVSHFPGAQTTAQLFRSTAAADAGDHRDLHSLGLFLLAQMVQEQTRCQDGAERVGDVLTGVLG